MRPLVGKGGIMATTINRVLIVNPPTRRKVTKEGRVIMPLSITFEPPRMPLSMAMMAGGLVPRCDVKVVDAMSEGVGFEKLVAITARYGPDLVVINCSTPTLREDLLFMRKAKEQGCLTALFGQHADALPIETMAENPQADFIFQKDPETVAPEFVRRWNEKENWQSTPGLVYRNKSAVVERNPSELIELDRFPRPARQLLNNDLYRLPDGEKYSVILASRGCPFRCPFCEASSYHGIKVRRRSPRSLVNEVEDVIREYGIRSFLFQSDLFTSDKNWVLSVCEEIVSRGLKIRWIANTRIDTADRDMLIRMKQAGCFLLGVGIESGNNEMLIKLGKRVTRDRIKEVIHSCQEIGIKTSGSFVVGFPGESEQSMKDTEELVSSIPLDFATFMTAYPFPGTELYQMMKAPETPYSFTDNWQEECFHGTPIRGGGIDERMAKYCSKMLRKQFLRPSYVLRQLKSIKSARMAFSVLLYALRKVTHMISIYKPSKAPAKVRR